MNIQRAATIATLASLLPFAGAALSQEAPTPNDTNTQLYRELEEEKQRISILERKLEIQQEDATTNANNAARITANASRFQISSADGANFIRFRGTIHADNRVFGGKSTPETADTVTQDSETEAAGKLDDSNADRRRGPHRPRRRSHPAQCLIRSNA